MTIKLLGQGNAPNEAMQRLINACMDIYVGAPADKAANATNMANAMSQALARHGLILAVVSDIRTIQQGFTIPDAAQDEGEQLTETQKIGAALQQFVAGAVQRIATDGLVMVQKKRRPAVSATPGLDVNLSLSVYAPGITQQQNQAAAMAAKKN